MVVKGIVFDFYNVLYDSDKKEVDTEVLEILKLLKNKYTLYLFTNSSMEFLKYNDSKTPFLNLFSKHVSVLEYGLHKPDKESFELLSNEIGLKPNELLLIDDKEGNIEEAKKYGFNTIHFIDVDILKEELKRYNISIGV